MNQMESAFTVNAKRFGMQQRNLVRVLVAERVKMLAYIDSLVRDEDLSEDLFQEVCMLAVEKAASIQDEQHLVKWLRTTARFHAMNALKKRRLRDQSLDDAVLDSLESKWQEDHGDDTSDWTEALRHCIDLLPSRARDLVSKRYVQEMNYEQLASEVGRPVGSLYVTFSRIFATLSDCITGQLRPEGKHIRG